MLNFDARVKNSDAAQPRVTNVKTPIDTNKTQQNYTKNSSMELVVI